MRNTATGQSDSSTVAVLHHGGGVWRMLVADTRGERPRILDHRRVPDAQIGELDPLLDPHRVGRVICVLPASTVICRSCTLPDAADEQLQQALRLQAEAQLLGSAPPHRLAMAVLHAAPGETSRAGIILAWPESAAFKSPSTARPITFAPDVAALAALLNGLRPSEPLLWLDRDRGSIAAAIIHSNGAAFRAAREDPSDDDNWRRSVIRTLAETALNVGHSDSYIDSLRSAIEPVLANLRSSESVLVIGRELRDSASERLDGVARDSDWWSEYGIAAGALLATTDQLQPLTQLKADPPSERPSPILAAIHSLSRPRAAAISVVICALLLALGPMLIAGLRLEILHLTHPDLAERKASIDLINNKLAMYGTLKDRAWSMTKLMSDIACNTPEGIELEWIRLEHGQSFAVKGRAMADAGNEVLATEVVGLMQEDLRDSGIFDDINLTWSDPDSRGTYKFELSARVTQPHRHKKYDTRRDFALWSMQDRVDKNPAPVQDQLVADAGAGSTPNTPPEVTTPPEGISGADETTTPVLIADSGDDEATSAAGDRPDNGRRPRVSRTTGPSGPGGGGALNPGRQEDRIQATEGGPIEVPDPIEPAQLGAMSAEALWELCTKIATAQKHASLDEETKERLDREFKLVFAEYKRKKQ